MEKKTFEGETWFKFSQQEKAQLKQFLTEAQSGNLSPESLKQLQGGDGFASATVIRELMEE